MSADRIHMPHSTAELASNIVDAQFDDPELLQRVLQITGQTSILPVLEMHAKRLFDGGASVAVVDAALLDILSSDNTLAKIRDTMATAEMARLGTPQSVALSRISLTLFATNELLNAEQPNNQRHHQ